MGNDRLKIKKKHQFNILRTLYIIAVFVNILLLIFFTCSLFYPRNNAGSIYNPEFLSNICCYIILPTLIYIIGYSTYAKYKYFIEERDKHQNLIDNMVE